MNPPSFALADASGESNPSWRDLSPSEILRRGAERLGIALDEDQIRRSLRYLDLLLEWNERLNLTAVRNAEDALVKHFLDSLTAIPMMPVESGLRLLDVGSGAGFPGLALKIARPDLRVTLLDAANKRLRFLDTVIADLGMSDAETLHSRAEDEGRNPKRRERYDVVIARAVADLRVLAELCLPLAKPGGRFLAMKGPRGEEEHEEAKSAIETLGGRLTEMRCVTLPFLEESRLLITYEKMKPTPARYPRSFAEIRRNPLS